MDTALAHGVEAMRIADELRQPFNQALACHLPRAAAAAALRPEMARTSAQRALAITTESRAPYYRAWSRILVCHAETVRRPDAGPSPRCASIDQFRASGARLRLPYYLGLWPGHAAAPDGPPRGWRCWTRRWPRRSSNERWWDAELHRLRGDLSAAGGGGRGTAAYGRSLEVARSMGRRRSPSAPRPAWLA